MLKPAASLRRAALFLLLAGASGALALGPAIGRAQSAGASTTITSRLWRQWRR
jgi:hypothetical protein